MEVSDVQLRLHMKLMKVDENYRIIKNPFSSIAFYMKEDEVIIIAFSIKLLLRTCLVLYTTSIHSFLEIRDLEKIYALGFVLYRKSVHLCTVQKKI